MDERPPNERTPGVVAIDRIIAKLDQSTVLVDRVWPRGRTKEQLRLDAWARDLGPSAELRKWFEHDSAQWAAFQERYRAELAEPGRAQPSVISPNELVAGR